MSCQIHRARRLPSPTPSPSGSARRASPVAAVLFPLLALACGSRTPLPDGDFCYEDRAVEPCATLCGEGTRLCTDGRWESCKVPVVERTCANVCGQGTQSCAADD